MRERAAKQGLFVADDGELVSAAAATAITAAAAAPAPADHAASFFSPPPAARPAALAESHSGERAPGSLALWPARPGALLANSPPTLLLRPADDAPLRLDVSAEEVWDRVEPISHDVFSFALELDNK